MYNASTTQNNTLNNYKRGNYMIGWLLGGIAIGLIFASGRTDSYKDENDRLRQQNAVLKQQNAVLRLTVYNHSTLLRDYDYVNEVAKRYGYRGCISFFYALGEEDERMLHIARFLNKVKHIRGDVAHNGTVYLLTEDFMKKLAACRVICDRYAQQTVQPIRYKRCLSGRY